MNKAITIRCLRCGKRIKIAIPVTDQPVTCPKCGVQGKLKLISSYELVPLADDAPTALE